MSAHAIDVLTAIYTAGGTVRIAGEDRLKVRAPAPLPNALMERLRAVKPDVRSLLSAVPADWIAGVASLDIENPPPTVRPEHWSMFARAAKTFSIAGLRRHLLSVGRLTTSLCRRHQARRHVAGSRPPVVVPVRPHRWCARRSRHPRDSKWFANDFLPAAAYAPSELTLGDHLINAATLAGLLLNV